MKKLGKIIRWVIIIAMVLGVWKVYRGVNAVVNTLTKPAAQTSQAAGSTRTMATAAPEATATPKPAATQAPAKQDSKLVNGMRPEFKEAMDAYEAFYDEYVAFMKKYMKNPGDLTMLADYADMMLKLEEMDRKFEAWNSEDLNDAELKYYLEVTVRIEQKLIGIM